MKSVHWNLTFQFVVITVCVYIALLGLGMFMVYQGLNDALDDQLDALLAEQAQRIELDGSNLRLMAPTGRARSQPFRPIASFQLFNNDYRLVGQTGQYRCAALFQGSQEIHSAGFSLRTKTVPIVIDEKQVGYLQAELPLAQRDEAIQKFALTIGSVTLIGFLVIGYAGYVFSQQASLPLILSYEMLRQFSTDVAHELNTPISTLRATAENMSEELDEPSSLRKRLEVMNRAIDRMQLIVKDLMLLTRLGIESAEPTKEPEQVALADLVENVSKEFADRFQQKTIDLDTKIEAKPVILGYPDPLHRMLANLLENAFRYTDSGGNVQVSLVSEHNNATITVSDTGMGIPNESLPKIFDRFYRVDKARSRELGGSGLGLAIVKAIATMHDAEVSVDSEIGKGSKFIVTLPLPRHKA